jgi:hypothetical protein
MAHNFDKMTASSFFTKLYDVLKIKDSAILGLRTLYNVVFRLALVPPRLVKRKNPVGLIW